MIVVRFADAPMENGEGRVFCLASHVLVEAIEDTRQKTEDLGFLLTFSPPYI